MLGFDSELDVLVDAVFQDEWELGGDGVVWLAGELYGVEEVGNYGGLLLVGPD